MTQTAMTHQDLETLRGGFAGILIEPAHPEYDAARQVHNGMIDRRPALIARCRGAADVVAAVRFARERDLEIAVRGGGHNVAGRAVCDDGLVIDLSAMTGVHVDPAARTAWAQAGCTWGDFNRETQLHALATTGGVISTTGVAGLTLGGGLGWLMGLHGLATDNLRAAEVVTADGEIVRASDADHADLFWALRGGGGNFGVVTGFEFQLHPVGPMVTAGLVAHPFDAARDVLRYYRDLTRSLPDELTAFAGLLHAPDGSGVPLAAIILCHAGSLEDGDKATRPIRDFGTPAMDAVGPMPYAEVNAMLDAGFPRGARNYWKSSFVDDLSDAAIDTLIAQFQTCPSPMSGLLLEHFHGAVTRVDPTATAFAHRSEGYNLLVAAEWLEAAEDGPNIAWARESYAAMQPFLAAGRYVNYLDDQDEAAESVAGAYGPNFARLQEIKRRYDPANVFHINQNITPG